MSVTGFLRSLTWAAALLVAIGFSKESLGQAEVTMKNGSILFGEVKKLEFAKLTLDTDDFGLIDIDWDPVATRQSTRPVRHHIGRWQQAIRRYRSRLGDGDHYRGYHHLPYPREQIGYFDDFDSGFWNRTSAGVDIGANIVRGNNQVTSLNVGINLGYASDVTEILLGATSIINEQQDASDTRRYTAFATGDRSIVGRFRLGLSASFERDEAQELDYRAPLTIFTSYRAISKQRVRLDIVVGGGPTLEKYFDSDGTSVREGKFGFAFISRPNSDTGLDFSSYVYPGLFELERWRVESDLVFRVEIIDDLNFNVTTYYRFNNEPPVDVDEHDFGITFGIGWSY